MGSNDRVECRFLGVRYSTLVEIADKADWSKKSYDNAISVLRRAFKFGYRDHPEQHDPTRQLKGARIQRKDRPVIDPFTIHEAETLIAALETPARAPRGARARGQDRPRSSLL